MRHYEREAFRHLDDSERYRDTDYLGDDAWIGPNETVPHGLTTAEEPPWWSAGPWERRAFAVERAFDEDRGQGRQYGKDLGLGYGRDYDPQRLDERRRADPYDQRIAEPPEYEWRYRRADPSAGQRPDEHIYETLRERLVMHAGPEADGVRIGVRDGEVWLDGIVEETRVKYLVEDIARDIFGVHRVHNLLRIRPVEDTRLGGSRQRSGGTSSLGSRGASRR